MKQLQEIPLNDEHVKKGDTLFHDLKMLEATGTSLALAIQPAGNVSSASLPGTVISAPAFTPARTPVVETSHQD